jgi:hypothetical protein
VIEQLLVLRRRQLERIGSGIQQIAERADQHFCLEIALIPDEVLHDCFTREIDGAVAGSSSAPLPATTPGGSADSTPMPRVGAPEEKPVKRPPDSAEDGTRPAKAQRIDGGEGMPNTAKETVAITETSTVEAALSPELHALLEAFHGDSSAAQLALLDAGSEAFADSAEDAAEAVAPVTAAETAEAAPANIAASAEDGAAADTTVTAAKAAAAEVERILKTSSTDQLLGGGSLTEQRREYLRLVRILHPDRSGADTGVAYRIVVASWKQAQKRAGS